MKEPLLGHVVWPIPDNKEITITLFKNQRTNEFEDKEWAFILEDVSTQPQNNVFPVSIFKSLNWILRLSFVKVSGNGKRRQIACANVNMKNYASVASSQQQLTLTFRPTTKKIVSASLECTLSCVLLREGKAT